MAFLIIVCCRCGGFLLAKAEQNTRTCPYCSHRLVINKAKKLASAETANEASIILRKFKANSVLKRKSSKHP